MSFPADPARPGINPGHPSVGVRIVLGVGGGAGMQHQWLLIVALAAGLSACTIRSHRRLCT